MDTHPQILVNPAKYCELACEPEGDTSPTFRGGGGGSVCSQLYKRDPHVNWMNVIVKMGGEDLRTMKRMSN